MDKLFHFYSMFFFSTTIYNSCSNFLYPFQHIVREFLAYGLRFSRLHDDFIMTFVTFVQLQRYYVGYILSLETKFISLKCRLAHVPNMVFFFTFLIFLCSSMYDFIINSNYSSLKINRNSVKLIYKRFLI